MTNVRRPVDILSPHLDDAAYSYWHGLERHDARVITVFAGASENGEASAWDSKSGFATSTEAIASRRSENSHALGIASVGESAIVDLDFPEAGYRGEALQSTEDIKQAIRERLRNNAQIVAPLGSGCLTRSHVDHEIVRSVALELEAEGRDVIYYPDIPYNLPIVRFKQWPIRLDRDRLSGALEASSVDVESVELTREERLRKQAGMRAYKSQFWPNNINALGTFYRPAMTRYEGLIRPVR